MLPRYTATLRADGDEVCLSTTFETGLWGLWTFGMGLIMSRFLLPLDALPRRLDQHMPTATDATTTDSREGRASTSKAHVVSDVKPMRETKGRNTEIS